MCIRDSLRPAGKARQEGVNLPCIFRCFGLCQIVQAGMIGVTYSGRFRALAFGLFVQCREWCCMLGHFFVLFVFSCLHSWSGNSGYVIRLVCSSSNSSSSSKRGVLVLSYHDVLGNTSLLPRWQGNCHTLLWFPTSQGSFTCAAWSTHTWHCAFAVIWGN